MEINDVRDARDLYLNQIKVYAEKKYDARPILDEYYRLTNEFKKLGGRPRANAKYLKKEYWENPANYSNQSKNANPILKVKNGIMVRKHPTNQAKYNYYKLNENNIIIHSKIEDNSKEFRLNVVGTTDMLNKMDHFCETFGYKKICSEEDKNIYIFQGSQKEFNILKRAIIEIMDVFGIENINIY